MADDNLVAVASDMGIRKPNASQREDLIYKILDQQAINLSANAPEEQPRRRGRKPKNQAQNQPQNQAVAEQNPRQQEADAENQPKRRGRKPRNAESQTPTLAAQPSEATAPVDAAVDMAAEVIATEAADAGNAQDETASATQPKRRGRKPKNQTIQSEPALELTTAEAAPAELLLPEAPVVESKEANATDVIDVAEEVKVEEAPADDQPAAAERRSGAHSYGLGSSPSSNRVSSVVRVCSDARSTSRSAHSSPMLPAKVSSHVARRNVRLQHRLPWRILL